MAKRIKKIKRKGFIIKRNRKRIRIPPTTIILKAKGKCPVCGKMVYRRGVRYLGRIFHKSCYKLFLRNSR